MKRSSDITREAVGEPVRTCVGCRSRDAQSRLVRVTVTDGSVVADPLGRAPIGRAPIGRAPIGRAPIGRAPIGRAPIGRGAPRMPGRGAYVHPSLECVDSATRRAGLARALRTRVDSTAVTALRKAVAEILLSRGDIEQMGTKG